MDIAFFWNIECTEQKECIQFSCQRDKQRDQNLLFVKNFVSILRIICTNLNESLEAGKDFPIVP